MRRAVTVLALALALALLVAACLSAMGPVPLLTGKLGCYAGGESGPTGRLVVDPQYGTSFVGRPVMWPEGYTARRAGSEVQVLDAHGNVKATTGRTYHISFAHLTGVTAGGGDGPFPAAVDCGYLWDFIDCTATPADSYCRPE